MAERFIDKLRADRERARKIYDPAERIEILNFIADECLDWQAELVQRKDGRGAYHARDLYRDAITEIHRLEDRHGLQESTATPPQLDWMPYAPDDGYEEPPDTEVEA